MMKRLSGLRVGAWTLVALASGCGQETMEGPSDEITTIQRAVVCSNDLATNAVMAAMANAAARDLRRWLPERDLQWNFTTWRLELSPFGRARCPFSSPGVRDCRTINTLLQLQNDAAQGLQFGGQLLDPGVLRARLFSYWDRQRTCFERPDNGSGDDCPAERHDLVFSHSAISATTCAGAQDFWYHAYYAGTTTSLTPADAAQLKNQLIWAGGTDNPFLAFEQANGEVKIDPIDDPGGGGGGGGSCTVASNYNALTGKCDATNVPQIVGSCCICGGQTRTWQPGVLAGWYVCKAP